MLHLIFHFVRHRIRGLDYASVVSQLCILTEDAVRRVRIASINALSILAQVGDKSRVLELVFELSSKDVNDEIIDKIEKHLTAVIRLDGSIEFKTSYKSKNHRSSDRSTNVDRSLMMSSTNRTPFSMSPNAAR